jgi:peroxiredoxin
MAAQHDFPLPPGLPVPQDDGACDHLPGTGVPEIALHSTAGREVVLARGPGRAIVYCYPMTGRPGAALPEGWDQIPGARGCTPESCGFRDHHRELLALGAVVYGLSTQDTRYQREAVDRLGLPFELLSDSLLQFTRALALPTFDAGAGPLIKRLTLVLRKGVIEKVFYPIFPPDCHAEEVVSWLTNRAG